MSHNELTPIPTLPKQQYADWLSRYFKAGDSAITLTFPEIRKQYTKQYVPDFDLYAKHIRHYLNVVNRRYLGNEWKAGRRKLQCVYTFELNSSNGVHAHMILELPPANRLGKDIDKHHFDLGSIWAKMKYTGDLKGTNFQQVYDAYGWLQYMFKDVKKTDYSVTSFNAIDWHLNAA